MIDPETIIHHGFLKTRYYNTTGIGNTFLNLHRKTVGTKKVFFVLGANMWQFQIVLINVFVFFFIFCFISSVTFTI